MDWYYHITLEQLKLQQMANKLLITMLLFSTMAFSQVHTIDCKLDSLIGILASKDTKIDGLNKSIRMTRKLNQGLLNNLVETQRSLDSLYRFKKYYEHSKHLLTPRLVGRIEDMVNND